MKINRRGLKKIVEKFIEDKRNFEYMFGNKDVL